MRKEGRRVGRAKGHLVEGARAGGVRMEKPPVLGDFHAGAALPFLPTCLPHTPSLAPGERGVEKGAEDGPEEPPSPFPHDQTLGPSFDSLTHLHTQTHTPPSTAQRPFRQFQLPLGSHEQWVRKILEGEKGRDGGRSDTSNRHFFTRPQSLLNLEIAGLTSFYPSHPPTDPPSSKCGVPAGFFY